MNAPDLSDYIPATDLAQAATMSARWYTDADFLSLEAQNLLPNLAASRAAGQCRAACYRRPMTASVSRFCVKMACIIFRLSRTNI